MVHRSISSVIRIRVYGSFIPLSPKNMNIIIIGATSGIGKGLLEKYATHGNRIGIVGRRETILKELKESYPLNVMIATVDITRQNDMSAVIKYFQTQMQVIDLVIVCSGVGELNPLLDYSVEYPTLLTNVVGWTHVIDTYYNLLIHQGFGHLVAITSIGGLRGESQAPAYSASKAYQINYMEALRKRAYKDGRVCVTDIRPGLVDTRMAKGENLFWVMSVEKVVNQIVKAIRRKKSKVYITKRWHVLAILNKNLPFFIFKKM